MITNNMPADFHTHILPSLDDGSDSVSISLQMLREESRQGIDTVVFTPHFYADRMSPDQFLKRRDASLENLFEAMRKDDRVYTYPEMLIGSEVHYFEGMSVSEQLRSLCIRGTNLILLEMPFEPWTKHVLDEVESIHSRLDIIPVIAHLDRYIFMQKRNGALNRLFDSDVFIQLNADSFLDRKRSKWATRILREGRVHFLGSDCHDIQHRPPIMGDAVRKIEEKLGWNETVRFINMSKSIIADAQRVSESVLL